LPIIEVVRDHLARRSAMACIRWSLAMGCAVLAWTAGASAFGQAGYGQMTPGARPTFRAPGSYERVSGRSNPALSFFSRSRPAVYTPPSFRNQQLPAPQPVQTAAYLKPHSGQPSGPSVSPYLALDQLETANGLPNYYLYVKPQLEQSAMNQAQQMQNRRMQKQLRRASTTGILPRTTSGGMPTTGHSTQFMNIGGFYPDLQQ
jgi:hypothetical protein